MIEHTLSGRPPTNELIVRNYLDALSRGRVVDALSAFAIEAVVHDEAGQERRGIRQIAEGFARQRVTAKEPGTLEVVDLHREGDEIVVRVRAANSDPARPQNYLCLFRVDRGRIRSLDMHPATLPRSGRTRTSKLQ